jgi:2,4-dienoyl-CoA reductase-like NADH-dependent reductase (Old Yellow Enzyme family)
LVDRVREAGGRIVMQLWHVGRIAHPDNRTIDARPVAPSPVAARGTIFTEDGLKPFPVPRALGAEEIARVCADYARAARNALRAGFDRVEILAANSNHRDDRYGGSIENRVRFLIEVAEAVGAEVRFGRAGVRLSPFANLDKDRRATRKRRRLFRLDGRLKAVAISKSDRDAIAERVEQVVFSIALFVAEAKAFNLIHEVIARFLLVNSHFVEGRRRVFD